METLDLHPISFNAFIKKLLQRENKLSDSLSGYCPVTPVVGLNRFSSTSSYLDSSINHQSLESLFRSQDNDASNGDSYLKNISPSSFSPPISISTSNHRMI